ncbi:MAG: hypothetical protein MZV63_56395 [Marinilabiliales bacterium]|nr:hypothetical protein [Marinilabiliales bacterium]
MSIDEIIERALQEDLGDGDHTFSCYHPCRQQQAKLIIKDNGILCGLPYAEKVFRKVDPELILVTFVQDGAIVETGNIVLTVEGRVRSILHGQNGPS